LVTANALIRAIGDGKRVAESIKRKAALQFDVSSTKTDRAPDITSLQTEQARRLFGSAVPEIAMDERFNFDLVTLTLDDDTARQEAQRCLQCDVMCNICTTVCPNRANITFRLDPVEFTIQSAASTGGKIQIHQGETVHIRQPFQIINIGDFCNECGNCTTFCPTNGEPYRAKPKFYLTPQSFAAEPNGYLLADGVLNARVDGELETLLRKGDRLIYETKDVRAQMNSTTYSVEEIKFTSDAEGPIDLRHAAQMAVLLTALSDFYIFN
jgi:putative selenate reductase